MLRYLTAEGLAGHPRLAETMFRDRAAQFGERLGWEVQIGPDGFERDQYDALNPLYLVWEAPGGRHGGSMRLLPTTGRTMVAEHFAHLLAGAVPRDPAIWECTRFCLAPEARPRVAAALMLGGGEILAGFGLTRFLGVFDGRMERVYRRIGAEPEVLGASGSGRERLAVGLWALTPAARARVALRAGLSPELARHWLKRSACTLPGTAQVSAAA